MEIDQKLADILARQTPKPFEGSVYRVTALAVDGTAASINGGRWAPAPNDEPGFPVLYTSLERDGAIAEVVSYLALQHPMPSKPLAVHCLSVTTSNTITLGMAELEELGVDRERYGERNYEQTQIIGATVKYIGLDGIITPCARWDCSNLTIFMDHHAVEEALKIVRTEQIDWRRWAEESGMLNVHVASDGTRTDASSGQK